ncbi:MAG: cell division protein FtsQ/DivIB [Candidatus Omnitrophota bacterium]|nr:cell division protein FtsQ/DivIB [Candidatus Omnitrophota bacterium]
MKKNKYKKVQGFNLKPLALIFFIFILFTLFLKLSLQFLRSSEYFKINKITYSKEAQFSRSEDIFDELIGKNLFSLNLKKISQKIEAEFPQLGQVKIARRLPDELIIMAFKRNPIAKVKLLDQYFYVDEEGVIISVFRNSQDHLPLIMGVVNVPTSIRIGQTYDAQNLKFGLEIIKEIDKITYLKSLVLSKVNVSNLSRASFMFADGIEIIIGDENIGERLKLLVVILSRINKELGQLKYIDLRFKEPVIARK